MSDDLDRRVQRLEGWLDNGRFLRLSEFQRFERDIRDEFSDVKGALGRLRGYFEEERKARENDRKGIRNLMLAALFSAGFSVIATFALAGMN